MKIAVPVTTNGHIDGHFGHCEFYNIFTISENNEIKEIQTLKSPQGCGCKSNIAYTLSEIGVNTMLAGGIGGGAINVLNNVGIEVIRGCAGKSEEIVKQYIEGLIQDSGSSCQHHEHHHSEGHSCNH
ncbi:MAG: NifB/NifX family molybdenum-iron cluster-binding protein [Bacteroidales bacterium]